MYPKASSSQRRGPGPGWRDRADLDPEALVLSLIPGKLRDTVQELRAVVKEAVPEVNEKPQPQWKSFNYDYKGALLSISGYQNYASAGFVRGDQLDDPDGVLEGTGKGMRHVRVARGAPVPAEAIARLAREAARLNERLGPPKGIGRSWGGGTSASA